MSTTPENLGALLLPWLKANAEEMARELRDDGWEEDERGFWSRDNLCSLHLFDAAGVRRETGGEP